MGLSQSLTQSFSIREKQWWLWSRKTMESRLLIFISKLLLNNWKQTHKIITWSLISFASHNLWIVKSSRKQKRKKHYHILFFTILCCKTSSLLKISGIHSLPLQYLLSTNQQRDKMHACEFHPSNRPIYMGPPTAHQVLRS